MTSKKQEKPSVITVEEIHEKAKGIPVDIPDWEPDSTITVRLRSIDVTPLLMESGAFPDELSSEVVTMFEDAEKEMEKNKKFPDKELAEELKKAKRPVNMEKLVPILDKIAEQSLAEPTFEEIQKIYPLTLQQKMAIFKFVTGGIESMKPFRQK